MFYKVVHVKKNGQEYDEFKLAPNAEEVVRCKDCRYWNPVHKADGYWDCDKRHRDGNFAGEGIGEWFCAEGEER